MAKATTTLAELFVWGVGGQVGTLWLRPCLVGELEGSLLSAPGAPLGERELEVALAGESFELVAVLERDVELEELELDVDVEELDLEALEFGVVAPTDGGFCAGRAIGKTGPAWAELCVWGVGGQVGTLWLRPGLVGESEGGSSGAPGAPPGEREPEVEPAGDESFETVVVLEPDVALEVLELDVDVEELDLEAPECEAAAPTEGAFLAGWVRGKTYLAFLARWDVTPVAASCKSFASLEVLDLEALEFEL